mmetsp:Transcript_57570/g.171680  ORF Transcript_57570/g.171680 Transcript_57570/m.171680 type:complete len:83 (-) Transcript_57570:49-297(-)
MRPALEESTQEEEEEQEGLQENRNGVKLRRRSDKNSVLSLCLLPNKIESLCMYIIYTHSCCYYYKSIIIVPPLWSEKSSLIL